MWNPNSYYNIIVKFLLQLKPYLLQIVLNVKNNFSITNSFEIKGIESKIIYSTFSWSTNHEQKTFYNKIYKLSQILITWLSSKTFRLSLIKSMKVAADKESLLYWLLAPMLVQFSRRRWRQDRPKQKLFSTRLASFHTCLTDVHLLLLMSSMV